MYSVYLGYIGNWSDQTMLCITDHSLCQSVVF